MWNLYDCAYRLFDVDDLVVNTLGATVGSLLSLLLVRRRQPDVVMPTHVSLGRRLVGFVCDVLFIAMLGAGAALAYRGLFFADLLGGRADPDTQALLQWAVPFAAEALMVLVAGRTVGELVVSVRAVARRPAWTFPSRVVKLATGVGPVFLLAPLDPRLAVGLLAAYAVLTVGFAWRTAGAPRPQPRAVGHGPGDHRHDGGSQSRRLNTGSGACFMTGASTDQGSGGTHASATSFSMADTIAFTPFSVETIIGVRSRTCSFISEAM